MTDIAVTSYHLSQVEVVKQWGCNADIPRGIEVVDDNVFVTAIGQRLQLFHVDSRQQTLLPSLSSSSIAIRCLRASNDQRFLAVGFSSEAEQAPSCLVYDAHMPMKWSSKPRRLALPIADKDGHWISVLEFSHDNQLLFCQLNAPDHTAFIIDWQLNEIRHVVEMHTQVLQVSFNPDDATRYCTCGDALLQVWRLGKRVQQIPCKGLSDPNATFTRHVWYGTSKLLVAGAQGDIWALENCEQTQAFQQTHQGSAVVQLLVRESMAWSIATNGSVCEFDLAYVSRNHRSGTAVELLRQFRLEDSCIRHVVWLQHNPMSLHAAVQLDTGIVEYNLGGDITEVVTPSKAACGSDQQDGKAESGRELTAEAADISSGESWHVLKPEARLTSFHCDAVASITSCVEQPLLLSRTFSTSPTTKPVLRLWHSETQELQAKLPAGATHDIDDNTPLAFHPSGRVMLVGGVDRVLQYTITVDSCCVTDEFVVKGTIRLFSGESYINHVSPSLLRFSHGAHLFAVVVGKATLILPAIQGKNRKRNALMVLSGQSQEVIDAQFSARDDRVWTLSKDGSVYQWNVGQAARTGEFLEKRITPSQLSIGPFDTPMMIGSQQDFLAKPKAKRTLQSVGKFIITFGLPSSRGESGASAASSPQPRQPRQPQQPQLPQLPRSHTTGGYSLFVWKDGLSSVCSEVQFPTPITAISSSRDNPSTQALASAGFVALGLLDGSVIVTTWPLQLVGEHNESAGRVVCTLDPRAMKVLNLHNGVVRCISLDFDGQYCFTAGDDAAVFTIQLYEDALTEASNTTATVVTAHNDLAMVPRTAVSDTNKIILDLQEKLIEQEREFGGSLKMKQSQQEDQYRGYEARLAREIKRRDDIIIQLRERIQSMEKTHQNALEDVENQHRSTVNKMEYDFEMKLNAHKTQSHLAKQAYEELFMTAKEEQEETQSALLRQNQEQQELLNAEKRALDQEREALLHYVDYMKEVYDSTITSIDDQHDKEIVMLRGTLKGKDDTLNAVINTKRKELHLLRRHILNLKQELLDRDNVFLDTREQLRRSADQIENLQQCLKQALNEVTAKTELSQHWESKAGEQSRKITELERVRKALTNQLHELRAEMVPKDDKISQLTRKLSEISSEYERQLKVLSTKDKDTTFRKVQATQLQRQLRDLRKQVLRREAILKHVATRCNQLGADATGNEMDCREEIQSLARTLQPYLRSNAVDESIEEQVFEQLENHNQKLRESIQQMQHTIASVLISSQAATQAKIEDNKILLEEINRHRKENKELTRLIQQGVYRPRTGHSQGSGKSPLRTPSSRRQKQRLASQHASAELLPSTLPLSRGMSRVKVMAAQQIPQVSTTSTEEQEDSLSLSTSAVAKTLEQSTS